MLGLINIAAVFVTLKSRSLLLFSTRNLETNFGVQVYWVGREHLEQALFFLSLIIAILIWVSFFSSVLCQNDLEIMAPKMPGCHQGGFALYKLMVEAAKDT